MRTAYAPPPELPGYTIIEPLARGGMAEAWLAQRNGDTGLLVVKRLLEKHAASVTVRRRILREAQIGVQLDHPNLVRTVDAGVAGKDLYIATEYLPGKDLEALSHTLARARRRFPLLVAARVVIEALRGVEAAHRATDAEGQPLDLVHRDLSPRNIQLGFDGRVAVIDFGLASARLGKLHTDPGTVLGTHRYMSPEQAIGEPVDSRSDLFTLGTVAYELFTGKWLFDEKNKPSILQALVEANVPRPSSVDPTLPPALDEVFARALAHLREERFSSARQMREAIEAALPGAARTPPSAIRELLLDVFPHDEATARERLQLARARGPSTDKTPSEHHAATSSDARQEPTAVVRSRGRVGDSTQVVARPRRTPPQAAADKTAVVRRERPRPGPSSDGPSVEGTAVVPRSPRLARPPGIDPEDEAATQGRFELIRSRGQGGMGRVYLAQALGKGELSVVKLMHPELAGPGNERAMERFRREAELLARFDHPHLVGFRSADIGEGTRLPYLELELVAGKNLAELAAALRGPLPPEVVVPLALELLDALHHAHQACNQASQPMGVVHRDISPHNLMVTFDGQAKLIDFGIAHRADEALTAVYRPLMGKPQYMAPEQVLQRPADRRTDVYAFALSLYELLSGRPVVDARLDPKPMREAIVHDEPPPLSELGAWPVELAEVLRRAMAKRPEDRTESAAALRHELDAAWNGARRGKEAIASFVRATFPDDALELDQMRDLVHADTTQFPSALWAPSGEAPPSTPRISIEQTAPAKAPKSRSRALRLALGIIGLLLVGGWAGAAVQRWLSSPPTRLPAEVSLEAPSPAVPSPIAAAPAVEAAPTPRPRGQVAATEASPPALAPPPRREPAPKTRRSPAVARSPATPPPPRPAPPPAAPASLDKARAACGSPELGACLRALEASVRALPEGEARSGAERCIGALEGLVGAGPERWHRRAERCLRALRI